MWGVISRLYNFTYEMLFRLSRRVYLLANSVGLTHRKPSILPPPTEPNNSKYISIDMEGQSPSPPPLLSTQSQTNPIQIALKDTAQPAQTSFVEMDVDVDKISSKSTSLSKQEKVNEQDSVKLIESKVMDMDVEKIRPTSTSLSTSLSKQVEEKVNEQESVQLIESKVMSVDVDKIKPASTSLSTSLSKQVEEKSKEQDSIKLIESKKVQSGASKTKLNSSSKSDKNQCEEVNNSQSGGQKRSKGQETVKAEQSQQNQQGNYNEGTDKSKRSKRKKKAKPLEADDDNAAVASPRPNFFVAFQVSNKDIKSKISEIQETMLNKELTSPSIIKVSPTAKIFKDTMVPVDKLHFTLHVFHLKDQDELQTAVGILERCYLNCKDEFEKNPMTVNIEGLGHFRNSVLFAKIQGQDEITRLETVCDALRTEFDGMNITGDSKVFKPHMTIAKMSRSKKLHKKKVRSFPPEMWSEFESLHFGHQRVESLQLLSMKESDPVTGYYRSVAEFQFLEDKNNKSFEPSSESKE